MRGKPRWTEGARAAHIVVSATLALAAPFVAFSAARAQTVRGILSERVTYAPIEGGAVVLVDPSADTVGRTITDERGYFSLEAARAGDYYLIASALGYRSVRSDAVTLEDGGVQIVELDMAPSPIPVEGFLVESEGGEPEIPGLAGTGFYDRMADGWGDFLAPGEVAAHAAAHTPQLFREMAYVELMPAEDGAPGPWNDRVMIRSNSKVGRSLEDRLCAPHIYIDGVLTELMPGEGLEDAAPRETIEAIEVHPAPFGAPLRYFRNLDPKRECGVVLIWTRRR